MIDNRSDKYLFVFVSQQTKDPSMFSSRVLRRAIEKAQFLQCHNFFHVLSITEIQGYI